jgi:hypothetical protein
MVVNGTVKTVYDVDRRLSLVLLLSGRRLGLGEREGLWGLVRDGMVEELLKKEAAESRGVVLDESALEGALFQVSERLGIERGSLGVWLVSQGILEEDLREMLRNEGVWTVYRRDVLGRSVVVGREEVLEEQDRLEGLGVRFLLSRMSVKYGSHEERVEGLLKMESLAKRVKEGGSFSLLAKNFSEDEYGDNGGRMGWVSEVDLPLWQRGEVLGTERGGITKLLVGEGEVVLLRVDERQDGGDVSFDVVRDSLFATKLGAQVRRRLKVVRENAYIDIRL